MLIMLHSVLFTCSLLCSVTVAVNVVPTSIAQKWGHLDIRDGAHMFYWTYYNKDITKPLVLWLQGGPGFSSSGIGNFMEIGPFDIRMNERKYAWTKQASILFVDSPVGSGFSYVNGGHYPKSDLEAARDLLLFLKLFYQKFPEFAETPLYVFGEGYGAKINVEFAKILHQAIMQGDIYCRFRGIGLGDPWLSPLNSVEYYASFMHVNSLIDETNTPIVDLAVMAITELVNFGVWLKAEASYSGLLKTLIGLLTDHVNMYNIFANSFESFGLDGNSGLRMKTQEFKPINLISEDQYSDLSKFMNGPVKNQLQLPKYVVWGKQRKALRNSMRADFMKSSVDKVEYLLNETNIYIMIYNGQLDLLVPAVGTEKWVNRLNWINMEKWSTANRHSYHTVEEFPLSFFKKYGNLEFHWILRAGHMVPYDASLAASKMLCLFTSRTCDQIVN